MTISACAFQDPAWAGLLQTYARNTTTFTLNAAEAAANGKIGYCFVPLLAKTVSAVRVYINAKTGTLGENDIECHIYDDQGSAAYKPNASLSSVNACSPAIDAATWVEFSGFSQAVAAYTPYWVVLKNVNATTASNYPTLMADTGNAIGLLSSFLNANYLPDIIPKVSKWNGSAWANAAYNSISAVVIVFSDGTSMGFPIESILGSDTDLVYGTRMLGVSLRTPPCKLVAKAVQVQCLRKGTVPNLVAKIYRGTTLVATSGEVPYTVIGTSTAGFPIIPFTSPVPLGPNTDYRFVIACASDAGDTSNYYASAAITWENSTTYQKLRLLGGAYQKSYYNGSTWADTANKQMPISIFLDSDYGGIIPLGTVIT